MSPISDDYQGSAPFEGPEKLLEIWFAPSANHVPPQENTQDCKTGLRSVDRKIWEEMLSIVQCKVLSVMNGQEMDAYLLRSGVPSRIRITSCFDTIAANLLFSSFPIGLFSKRVALRLISWAYLAFSKLPQTRPIYMPYTAVSIPASLLCSQNVRSVLIETGKEK